MSNPSADHKVLHAPDSPHFGVKAALFGLCPQCGAQTLFDRSAPFGRRLAIQFAPRCAACDLDYDQFNVGDGASAFLTFIIGGLLVVMALWVDVKFAPPIWVHALLWIPFTLFAVLLGLRLAKAALIGAEYRNNAGEAGRDNLRTEDGGDAVSREAGLGAGDADAGDAHKDNVGKRNIAAGNTGTGNTGTGNTGTGNTGTGNTGTGNTGTGNTGTDNTGAGNTGAGNTGTGNTGKGEEK